MAVDIKKPKVKEKAPLKPLAVSIYNGGKVVRTVELPDPRTLYIDEFNRQAGPFGLKAGIG